MDNNSKILFGDEAQRELMVGVNLVCDAAGVTLGARGRNVAIDKKFFHLVIHDGVKTSLEVSPRDPYHRLGAKIAKEASKKQRDEVGDGTTVVLVLTQAILKEATKIVASGVNPMALRKGLEVGAGILIDEIKKISKPIKTLQEKISVATVSAEDLELGKLIAETVHKIGDDGVIVVEESKMAETVAEIREGMEFDRGYSHPWLITDPERQLAVLDDVHVLITDKPLNSIAEIGKFLNETVINQAKVRKMVFISPEIGGDFLTSLVVSKINKGEFLGLAVKAPMLGSHQTQALQDLCAMTGAKLISKEAGHNFDEIDMNWMGKVDRIISSKNTTTITGGHGLKDDVLNRIAVTKKQMEETGLSDFDKEKLKERLAKLTNGVAVIKVGGETEVEMNERKERVDDAKCATQAAVKHGIVPGGEIIYLMVREKLDKSDLGQKILYNALLQPFRKLVENAGYDGGELYNEFKHTKKGFNVVTGEWVDMIKTGILDPTLVPVTAIKSAVSVAIQILTTGAAIVPDNEEVPTVQPKKGN